MLRAQTALCAAVPTPCIGQNPQTLSDFTQFSPHTNHSGYLMPVLILQVFPFGITERLHINHLQPVFKNC